MNKNNLINIYTNPQPIPSVFNEGFSQYETVAKMIAVVNDLINNQNLGADEIEDLKNKKADLEYYLNDIKNNRKLDENGNFTGTWNGMEMASSEQGLSSEVVSSRGVYPFLKDRLNNVDEQLNDISVNVKLFGAHSITEPGFENFDSTTAIQQAIDGLARGGYGKVVYIPSGVYKITQTLILPSCVLLKGAGSQQGQYNQGGTELQWHGADGGTLIQTSVDDISDWSKGLIQDIRLKNIACTTSGWGLKVRNPQNGSRLKNIHIASFPTRQCLVYEATPNPRGSSPGFFSIEDGCFFVGGEIPLEIEQGVEQVSVRNIGIDTDAKTTVGCLINGGDWPGASVAAQRWSILFDSCKIEIRAESTAESCEGFKWNVNSPVTFINCDVIRTVVPTAQAVNTASFHYTNPTNKVPTAEIINCSSWNMDTCFRAEEAGIMIKPTTLNTAKSFSYSRKGQDILLVFGRADLGANMNSASIPYAGLTGIIENAGIVMPKDGVITTLTARSNGAITAGSLTVKGYKNDVNLFGQNILSSSAQQGIVNIDNYIFNAGDKISVYAYSTADFTPYGTLDIVVSVLVKLLYC